MYLGVSSFIINESLLLIKKSYAFFLLIYLYIYIYIFLFSCNYDIHLQATGLVKHLMADMKLLLLMGKVSFLL